MIGQSQGYGAIGIITPYSSQTIININLLNKATGTLVYAVPTGKTFYIRAVQFSQITGASFFEVQLTNGAGTNYLAARCTNNPAFLRGNDLCPLAAIPSGTNLKLEHDSGGSDIDINLNGWIE